MPQCTFCQDTFLCEKGISLEAFNLGAVQYVSSYSRIPSSYCCPQERAEDYWNYSSLDPSLYQIHVPGTPHCICTMSNLTQHSLLSHISALLPRLKILWWSVFPSCLWVYCLVPQGITMSIPPVSLLKPTAMQSHVISVAARICVTLFLWHTIRHCCILQFSDLWLSKDCIWSLLLQPLSLFTTCSTGESPSQWIHAGPMN